jgi:oligopeptidase A
LANAALPDFGTVAPAHIAPAIQELVARCEQALASATHAAAPVDYDALTMMIDVPLEALSQAWGVVGHLQAVVNTPELRAAYAEAQPKVTALQTRVASDLKLFALYKLVSTASDQNLSIAQRKALDNALQAFRLAGAELSDAQKERFAATEQRSAELSRDFSNHLLDATDAFVHWATAEDLAGVPEDVLLMLGHAAKTAGREDDVYKLSLQLPCLGPVLQYAHNRLLRETLYRAQATRASEFGPPELDNTSLVAEMVMLHHERAAMLGHSNYAEVSLIPKMADSPAQVLEFLRDLAARCRPQAQKDLDELRLFAREELGIFELEVWDVAYASEKLRQARYAFSEQEVKQHFNLDTVLRGLFGIAETLFDIEIRSEAQPAWHESVTAYRVERAGELLGRFFLDPYARAGKRAGAWLDGATPRWRKPGGELRTAVAYLVTNCAAPVEGKPALMSHHEVVTLFHEFGHGFHHLLSNVEVLGVSGITGVEWDAVELPSQLMENFAWEWPILQRISAHAETGEPLPRELFDKMLAARNFQSGMQLLRQVELALFDMRLHAEPKHSTDVQALFSEVRAETALMQPPAYNRFQNAFSHVFAGGYAAGYYSYLWAEVLSADAWSQFAHAGALDAGTGKRYLQAILERGGSRKTSENFKEFVGRAPKVDALLIQRGVLTAS